MTPWRFIKLKEANDATDVVINANHIVAIRDLRHDPAITGKDKFQWTNIECVNNTRYNVRETENEILEMLSKIQ